MPMLMEKSDRLRTAERVRNSSRVWFENIAAHSGSFPLNLPEAGDYQIFFIKVDRKEPVKKCPRPDATKFLGYGKRFHKLRTTEEWMKELREGEEE